MNVLKYIKIRNRVVFSLVFTMIVVSSCSGLRTPFDAPSEPGSLAEVSSPAMWQDPSLPDQELLARLYDDTARSVVNIQVIVDTSSATEQLPQQPFEFPFPGSPFDLPEVPQGSEGSGFIYDDEGHIITNNHVIENAKSIIVNFANGMWTNAEILASDPQSDLAVLKVTPPEGIDWRPLPLAEDGELYVGHYVIALGSPFGLDETMTLGIVSAVGRSFRMGDPTGTAGYSLPDVIQTDAAINPGNSGGPLLNLDGEIVGVNFAINSATRSNAGVGFAIPVSVVGRVVPALIEEGSFRYAYLGISGQTIDAIVAENAELDNSILGVLVSEVVADGPSDGAGVQAQDIIIGIDEQPVHRFEDLISYLFHTTEPGQIVTLHLLRDGEEMTLDVELTERPSRQLAEQAVIQGGGISITEAIAIAREEVLGPELLTTIESVSAKKEILDSGPIWVVTLMGEGGTAVVTVDATTGEVLELKVQ